jgi:hypothetical protein
MGSCCWWSPQDGARHVSSHKHQVLSHLHPTVPYRERPAKPSKTHQEPAFNFDRSTIPPNRRGKNRDMERRWWLWGGVVAAELPRTSEHRWRERGVACVDFATRFLSEHSGISHHSGDYQDRASLRDSHTNQLSSRTITPLNAYRLDPRLTNPVLASRRQKHLHQHPVSHPLPSPAAPVQFIDCNRYAT